MPILSDFRKTKEISLPTYPDSKIIIYSGVLIGDALTQGPDESELHYSLRALPVIIKEWNFTNEQGEPLPINDKTLGLLRAEELTYLILEMQKFIDGEKKN